MKSALCGAAVGALSTMLCVVSVGAQSLADRIERAPDGRVRMTFAARPGICANGDGYSIRSRGDDDWEWECDPGLVRVVLSKDGGDITRVRTYVGGRWREGSTAFDLGTVAPGEAAGYLVALAERTRGRISRDAIRPVTMADSADVWRTVIRIARDRSRERQTRRSAAQWLGIVAGDAVMDREGSVAVDDPTREDREQAVFALSQLRTDEAIPALIDVARMHRDPLVRRRALFWLGQKDDGRAVDLFEEILRSR